MQLDDFSFPPLVLPQLDAEEMKRRYDGWASELREIASSAGKGSNAFARRKMEILSARWSNEEIEGVMTSSSYIRPLIDLWRTDDDFFKDRPPCRILFELIKGLAERTGRGRLSRLSLRELCLLFFERYDNLTELNDLGGLICSQLERYTPSELVFGMDKLRSYRDEIFKDSGHEYLAKLADKNNKQPLDVAKEYGVTTDYSRIFEKTQKAYYLQKLKNLKPNEKNYVLEKVRDKSIAGKPFDANYKLGHKVMEILIDKLVEAGEKPNQDWLDTILAIGDDPRVPPSAWSFRIWWKPLGEERKQAMWNWLSTVDLDLFLRICKDYVGASNRGDILRMYPPRAAFLRSLLKTNNGNVRTHLFLGSSVRKFIKDSYKDEKINYEKINYTALSGNPHLSVFYIIIGNVYIVEGTFSFTLKIMDKIPSNSVLDYQYRKQYIEQHDTNTIPDRLLRKELEEAYKDEFPYSNNMYCCHHFGNGIWMKKALFALKQLGMDIVSENDLNIELSKVYDEFIKEFPLEFALYANQVRL